MKSPSGQPLHQGDLDFNQSPGNLNLSSEVSPKISSIVSMSKRVEQPEFTVFNFPSVKLPFAFKSSEEVYESMKEYHKADREMFMLLMLDSKNNVLKIEPHSIGTVDSCAVYPREIFKSAILNSASSIICLHHHPSGDTKPSEADKQITKQIVYAGHVLGVKVLDHIIIGDDCYFSFADQGLMDEYEKSAENVDKGEI